MKAEGLKVELNRKGWHLFDMKNWTKANMFSQPFEKCSVQDRKPSRVLDRKPNVRFKNRFRKLRDGMSGRYTAHETDARDAEEEPNSEEEESKWMNWPRWWKNWKTRLTHRTWKICESFQSPCTKDSPPSVRQTQSKKWNRGYQPSSSASSYAASGSRQSSLSGGGRGRTEETRNSLF